MIDFSALIFAFMAGYHLKRCIELFGMWKVLDGRAGILTIHDYKGGTTLTSMRRDNLKDSRWSVAWFILFTVASILYSV